jgi:hypothetical protein
MSKSKKNFRVIEREYYDGEDINLRRLREEKNRNHEKRIQHALKTKNVNELLDLENDEDEWDDEDYYRR